jgi:sugar phosphate isomerase/epimerase
MILVSTTYYKKNSSCLENVLSELSKLDIDGIEIGSTHKYNTRNNFKKIIKKIKSKKIFIHNFFPPSRDTNFVINIASDNKKIRENSVDLIISNIDFCKEVSALLYTIHPGFLSEAVPQSDFKKKNYDFIFCSKNRLFSKKLGFNNMIISLKKIIGYANKKKVKIALETEGSIEKSEFLIMQTPAEYKELFLEVPNGLYVNFNIAHSFLSSINNKFSLKKFIKLILPKIAAVEISSNNGTHDQHLPLTQHSKNLHYLKFLKNKPVILEFRNASIESVKKSLILVRKINEKNNQKD